jgi:thiol-disulfide isomerase/thioredoxin
MRKVIAALLVVAVSAAGGYAQEKKDEKKAKLGVGDAAPPITKVTAWLNGSPVTAFEKDKVYVLEFWATWCGPCIAAMPHLTELGNEYKAKGLVVIGMTNKDDNGNNKESVTRFVEKNKGEKLGYAVAYSDGEENNAAYMEAAGQNGIPCSFVIGKDGKVAYIGHPVGLDMVLPKVLDGTWKGKADAEATEKAVNEMFELLSLEKPEAGLEKLTAFRKKYPELAAKDELRQLHLGILFATKKFDDAKALAEEYIAVSEKKKKAMPAAYAIAFAIPQANPDKKHFDLGVKALETALKFDDKDVGLMLAAVQVYTAANKPDKATEYGKKAIEAVPEKDRKQVEKIIEEIKKGK